MPGMDGFETAALIRQRQRSETTPIIFISAVNDTETHVSRGYSLGAVDYILTPVVPEILRAKIAVFVDLYKKTEQVKRQAEEREKLIREQAARAEAEARQERLAFLADASNVLAGSLEFQETFQNLANLVVPRLADFCVSLRRTTRADLRQVAVAHPDFAIAQHCDAWSTNFRRATRRRRRRACVGDGKSTICCDMNNGALQEVFPSEEDRSFRSLARTHFTDRRCPFARMTASWERS